MATSFGLPGFLIGCFVMFWSLPLSGLFYRVKFFNKDGRNDMFDWGFFLTSVFGVKLKRYGPAKLYRGEKCMYLCNHRSWCDFFLDAVLTEGRAAVLTRGAVLAAFFMSLPFAWLANYIFVFNRGNVKKDVEKFNLWLDKKLVEGPLPGILVFPEGHRNLEAKSLPLKPGMLKYAYSRKIPVQSIITVNKEAVINEKKMSLVYGATLVTGYTDVIEPKNYKTFEEFAKDLQLVWDEMWDEVHVAAAADVRDLDPQRTETYTLSTRKFLSLLIFMLFANGGLLLLAKNVLVFVYTVVRLVF